MRALAPPPATFPLRQALSERCPLRMTNFSGNVLLSQTRRAVLRHGHTPASAFQSSSAEWGQSGQLTFNPATSSSAFSFRPHEGHKKRNSITQVLCLLSGMISNHPPKSKPKSALARKSQRSIRCPDGKNLVNPDFPDSLHKSMSLTCNGAT